ncbi:uncharacterized protein J3R85_003894 [Psidium guajava]|nr:uncharacterized protein J3R85_003894 [Psidium guajava]
MHRKVKSPKGSIPLCRCSPKNLEIESARYWEWVNQISTLRSTMARPLRQVAVVEVRREMLTKTLMSHERRQSRRLPAVFEE